MDGFIMDAPGQQFQAYIPGQNVGMDFPIEGGMGYIVNLNAPKAVTFEGHVWSNQSVLGAPSERLDPLWAFVVVGKIEERERLPEEAFVLVSNRQTGTSVKTDIASDGQFVALFFDSNKQSVAASDGMIAVEIAHRGARLRGRSECRLSPTDLANAYTTFVVSGRPEQTTLLANYPNPFNPETWIPFELAEASDVVIRIYDARGELVRTLDLGRREPGVYESQSDAAYWDGRNELGEPVAGGVYFYELRADTDHERRRMVIVK